jgi:sphingosine kinase
MLQAAQSMSAVRSICSKLSSRLRSLDTTHGGHAKEIGRNLPLEYDAVASVSGDGLIHELLNGFKDHNDPVRAFSIPLAPIPAGSGNALSLNLLGLEVVSLLSTMPMFLNKNVTGWL